MNEVRREREASEADERRDLMERLRMVLRRIRYFTLEPTGDSSAAWSREGPGRRGVGDTEREEEVSVVESVALTYFAPSLELAVLVPNF